MWRGVVITGLMDSSDVQNLTVCRAMEPNMVEEILKSAKEKNAI